MQIAKPLATDRWSQNAIGSLVALFLCFPLAPVLALLALRDCAHTPGLKGRGLAFAVLLVSFLVLTIAVLAFLLGSSAPSGSTG